MSEDFKYTFVSTKTGKTVNGTIIKVNKKTILVQLECGKIIKRHL